MTHSQFYRTNGMFCFEFYAAVRRNRQHIHEIFSVYLFHVNECEVLYAIGPAT